MRQWISNGSVRSLRRLRDGRPTLDAVLKFKTLALQNLHRLSLDTTETMGATGSPGFNFSAFLVGRVGQGVAEGHGSALDGQVQRGEGQAGRQEASRHRHSGLRLKDPHQHRKDARDYPPPDRDGHHRE